MKVMLLAAGEGQRLRPYTIETPKPAIPFLTAPLASFSLALLEQTPIDKIVVNTFHQAPKIDNLFHWMKLPTTNLVFSHEHDKLLGSGGGIHKAKAELLGNEPFIVMNADEVILPHHLGLVNNMLDFHHAHKGLATLMTMPHPEVGIKFGGAWGLPDSTKIELFSKTPPAPDYIGHHFIGGMVLDQRIFKYFKNFVEEENIIYETLTKAISLGEEVHAFSCTCEWFETGNPQDFLAAIRFCLQGLESTPEAPWCQHLAQTLRIYGEGQLLIENSDPALVERIARVLQQQVIRLDKA